MSKVLDAPNLTFTNAGINMADLMGSGEPHDCAKKAEAEEKITEDLRAEPIPGAEDWFTNGCCRVGGSQTGSRGSSPGVEGGVAEPRSPERRRSVARTPRATGADS